MNEIKSSTANTGNHFGAAAARLAYESQTARVFAVRERVIDVSTCSTIDAIGAVIGQPLLGTCLIADGLLMADGLPYQHYIDCDYFAVVEGMPGRLEVLVTQRGKVELARRYLEPKRASKGACSARGATLQ